MITAIDIMKKAVERVNVNLKNVLHEDIKFHHGHTLTVSNYLTQLQSTGNKEFPAIIVFTENMTEKKDSLFIEFTIPKVVICTLTMPELTEKERLGSTFKKIIYPIFENLQKELEYIHFGYNLNINRVDVSYFKTEARDSKTKNMFNDPVDGCIIKNLKMKIRNIQCIKN